MPAPRPWRDCSAAADGQSAPASFGPYAITVDRANASFPTYRPVSLKAAIWPVLVFMHGSGSDDRFMSPSTMRWASHGFIVVTPLMGIEALCTTPAQDANCSDHSPDGVYIQAGISWIRERNAGSLDPVYYRRVDTDRIAIGGWSMGGVTAIRAASALPSGVVKAVILDSPSVRYCETLYNYTREGIDHDVQMARKNTAGVAPWFVYTATNDLLQNASLSLFESAGNSSSIIYAQYQQRVCKDKPLFLNTTIWEATWQVLPGFRGHCCAGLDTMIGWTTTFLKETLQQRSNSSSACIALLYGNGSDAMASDARMDDVRLHRESHR